MNANDFKLTPAYCLFNGTAVVAQNGTEIRFMVEDAGNLLLQERLKKAFTVYVENMRQRNICSEEFLKTPKVIFEKGSRQEIRRLVSELYENTDSGVNQPKENNLENTRAEEDAAAVLLLDNILNEARDNKATDIHIERNCVRYRLNGKLENQVMLQKDKATELVQRIKLLAGMNVIEKRRSQDGHFIYGEEKPLFVRVSTMAIISQGQENGDESVVMRVLDTSRIPLSLGQLGFSSAQFEGIKSLCSEKNGLIVICGPTGAGKSTTAASMLLEIQKEQNGQLKIISLEDPPEYIIPGVTQIQIDDSRKNTYDDALQHVFRQDPDVIMIGEIRDEKSAAAAIRASLTGHLVVATLHTSSAAGSVLRLENLCIGRKIIGSVLKGVIVQDLNYSDIAENGIPSLLADVALPGFSFAADLTPEMAEIQVEKLFDHITNFADVITQNFLNRTTRKPLPVFGNHFSTGLEEKEA